MDKGKHLDSWKEVSAYLGRTIRTCQKWESELGLPVHRLDGSPKARIFAYTDELDAWREKTSKEAFGKVGEGLPKGLEESPMASQSETGPARRQHTLRRLAVPAVVIFLAGLLIGRVLFRRPPPAPPASVVVSTIKVAPGYWLDGRRDRITLQRPTRPAMAISGDGKFVVYSAIEEKPSSEAKPKLFLRRFDQQEAKPIAGTEGGINPFLSPDNRWVGFWADSKLKKVPVEGGVPIVLCETSPRPFGANWGRNHMIAFAALPEGGLSSINDAGGDPELLSKPDPKREELSHRLPYWLPSGKAVLFTVMRSDYDRQPSLALLQLETGERKVLLQDAADARYIPSGHIVFLRRGTLLAVRFDPVRLEVIGQPVALVENVMQGLIPDTSYNTGAAQLSISDSGSLIYIAGGVIPDREDILVWVDQKGGELPVADLKRPFLAPRLSPDGGKIAYSTMGQEFRIYVYDIARGTDTPLTGDGLAVWPIWSPDGKRIIFGWQKSLVTNLFWQASDGSSPMERLTTSEYHQAPSSWSPDGNLVAFNDSSPDTPGNDISILDVRSRRVTPFLNSKYNESFPDFSPDGRWLAYSSNESGRNEVYVRAFPGPGIRQQISGEGGQAPLWARNGKQLFYRRLNPRPGGPTQIWAVDVQSAVGFSTSRPRLLFETWGGGGNPTRCYDLSLDSKRFLLTKPRQMEVSPATEMILIQNWFEELKRLLPTGKE